MKYKEITSIILKSFYTVHNELGYGFLEKVYEKAMMIELKKYGLSSVNQQPINVYYEEEVVGQYFADIIVKGKVIVELKALSKLAEQHEAQLINYLKATDKEVGLLLNFGRIPKFKRKVFTH